MDQEIFYVNFDVLVFKFVDGLKQLGVKKGDYIVLIVGNLFYFVIGLYGVF